MSKPKPKQMQSRKTTVPIILGILILIPVSMFIFSKVTNSILHHRVFNVVRSELQAIPLYNSSSVHKVGDGGCSYDEKVRKTRCPISYDRFFGTNEDDANKVLKDINSKLLILDWKISPFDETYLSNGWQPGYGTISYYKDRSFGIKATISVARGVGLGTTESDHAALQKQFKHVYSITVSTDYIPSSYKWY